MIKDVNTPKKSFPPSRLIKSSFATHGDLYPMDGDHSPSEIDSNIESNIDGDVDGDIVDDYDRDPISSLFPRSSLDWISGSATEAPHAGFRGGSRAGKRLAKVAYTLIALAIDFCMIAAIFLIHLLILSGVLEIQTIGQELLAVNHRALWGFCFLLAAFNYYLICWRTVGKSLGLWAGSA